MLTNARWVLFATAIVVGSGVDAQTYSTVPNGFAGVHGGTVFFGPTSPLPRTYQLLIHESQLTEHLGRTIDGVSWRLPSFEFASWPTYDETYPNFDIRLSQGVAPANRVFSFASNVVGAQTLVRSGPLLVPAISYLGGGNPNAWGPVVAFQTGYPYSGGNLLIELRHAGFTGQTGFNVGVDAINTAGGPPGVYGNLVSACWVGTYDGQAGTEASFSVVRLRSSGASTTVSGRVDFADRVGNVPTTVNIEFQHPDHTLAHTAANVTVAANGDLVTSDLPATPSSYFISIQRPPWLRRTLGPSNTANAISGLNFGLVNGDCDGDNEIGIGDYAVLSAAYGSNPTSPNWAPEADLDGDDEVSIGDYAVLSGNFGEAGDD